MTVGQVGVFEQNREEAVFLWTVLYSPGQHSIPLLQLCMSASPVVLHAIFPVAASRRVGTTRSTTTCDFMR
jgi:hypothetical protein